jgi:hypothetical protein
MPLLYNSCNNNIKSLKKHSFLETIYFHGRKIRLWELLVGVCILWLRAKGHLPQATLMSLAPDVEGQILVNTT